MYGFVDSEWFKNLFPITREMPLELVVNTDELSQTQKEDVLSLSLVNLHRVLSFSKLDDELISDDPEQFWVDTIINIEDTSYYASMLLPYLRQVIEDNTETDFTSSVSVVNYLDSETNSELLLRLEELFNIEQSKLLYEAIKVSRKIKQLDKQFHSLADAKEFHQVCLSVYAACAEVIRLSYIFMLPSSKC